MTDAEKVINWFEVCRVNELCSTDCPYWDASTNAECAQKMASDALSVIRELKAENERLKQEKADAVERIERCRQNCISSEKDCDSALDREGKEINRAKAYAYQWVLNIINKTSI